MKTKLRTLSNSLQAVGVPKGVLFQIGYYAIDLNEAIEQWDRPEGWRRFRRTEMIRVYPGREPMRQAIFYVATNRLVMDGMEVELIRPLTEPNYINMLEIKPGNVAHLAVRAERVGAADDQAILKRFSSQAPQMVQEGEVRQGRKVSERYKIYQLDDFLPIKVVRNVE